MIPGKKLASTNALFWSGATQAEAKPSAKEENT
jgi:hypothetical protein